MKKCTSKLFLAVLNLFVFVLPSAAVSGDGEYVFRRVGYSDGLSHSAVLSLFQDNTDLVWMGTYDGLDCYDGASMHVYRSDFSADGALTNNIISSICQADGDNLWVNTFQSLNRLSKSSGEITKTFSFGGDAYLSSNSKGNTWLLSDNTLYYYSTVHEKFIRTDVPVEPDYLPERRFFVNEQGEMMYFGREDGNVRRYSLSSWDEDSTSTQVRLKEESFHPKPINDIFYQTGMMCFVDRDDDLYLYDVARKTKVYIRNLSSLIKEYGAIGGIVPFYEDFLIGFHVNGLFRLKAFSKYEAEPVDRNIRIFCLYHDLHQGVIWIGSDGQGALMYAKKYSIADNIVFSSVSGNLSRPVRSILTDKHGGMWVGTKGDGIVYFPDWKKGTAGCEIITPSGRRPASGYRRESREFKVYSIKESRFRNGVWIGAGEEGLMFCPYGGVPSPVRYPDDADAPMEIHDIYEMDENTLYVSSAGMGIHKLTIRGDRVTFDKKYSFYFEGKEVDLFYSMKAVGDSLLYAGSRGDGLVRLDIKTEEYSVISMRYLYNEAIDDILSLCPASDGSLYVGTVSGLLRLYNSGEDIHAEHIGKKNGLVNDMIHGILEDGDGMLWLGTDRGLVKYNPANGLAQTYLFTAGLEIGEFSDDAYYKDPRTGRLFLGGNGGLISLADHTPEMVQYFSDIQLRSLKVAHEEVRMSDYTDKAGNLVFNGGEVSFAVTFAVPDYQASGLVEYSALLEGYDKDWSVYTLDNTVSYTDVPAGRYTLRIRYKKDVYDTLPEEYSIKVRIRRSFFKSPFFLTVLGIIFAALLLYSIFSYRNDQRKKRDARDMDKDMADFRKRLSIAYADTFDNAAVSRMTVREISDSVLGILAGRGAATDGIRVIGSDVPFPLHTNYMKRLLMVIYDHILSSGGTASLSCAVEEKSLHMVLEAEKSLLAPLYRALSGGSAHNLTMKFCEDSTMQMDFLSVSAEQGIPEKIVYDGKSIDFVMSPAVARNAASPEKERLLLLESSPEMFWLLSDLLSADYEIINATDTASALRSLKHSDVSLIVVDAHLGIKDENSFRDTVSKNRTAISDIPFVVILGEGRPGLGLGSELISWSDSYAYAPEGVPLLKEVISRAVDGKKDFRRIKMEELGSLADDIICSNEDDIAFVRKTIKVLSENIAREDLGTALIADRMAMTPRSFYRRFRSISHITPGTLIKIYRLEMASRLLLEDSKQILDVIAEVGISSRSYFYKEFTARFGTTPGNWKNSRGGSAEQMSSK
ncbi:MAG: helix-turn-helix domain-containing protein [Bacteroidota bacterium]|nr:helix-turn-helix domain-containing protein [Bacteroidota bacterium]